MLSREEMGSQGRRNRGIEKGSWPGLTELVVPFGGTECVGAMTPGGSPWGVLCSLGSLGEAHRAAGVWMCSWGVIGGLPVSLSLSCGVFGGRVRSLKGKPCAWPSPMHSPSLGHREWQVNNVSRCQLEVAYVTQETTSLSSGVWGPAILGRAGPRSVWFGGEREACPGLGTASPRSGGGLLG